MYAHVEPYQRPYHPLIFYLFFPLFKLLFSLFYKNKLYKKKNSSSPYWSTFIITIPLTFPFPLYLFISPLLSTYCYTSLTIFSFLYFEYSSPPFFFIQIRYHFSYSIHIFHTKKLYVLSLFLSLSLSGGFLFFLITLIEKNVFWKCIFFFF